MEYNRRNFFKLRGAGIAGLTLMQLGCGMKQMKGYASGLKIEGAQEVISICPFCSVSCHIIAHVRNGRLVSTEGDPDYPINEGALCAKGAAMLSATRNAHRLTKPLYRAPYSDKWEEKSWDWMLDRIAQRTKATRDTGFVSTNKLGRRVNRVENLFTLGTSRLDTRSAPWRTRPSGRWASCMWMAPSSTTPEPARLSTRTKPGEFRRKASKR